MTKFLAIGLSVRAMVESAVRSNYPVVALDGFGDRDLRALTECYALTREFGVRYSPQALLTASRALRFDSVAYTSNLENYPEILDSFDADYCILGNSSETIRSVRDWPNLFSRLERAGFAVPQMIFAGTDQSPDPSLRWLLKPVRSGGGRGISLLPNGTGAVSDERHLRLDHSRMLQQFIPGRACSASFVGNGLEAVLIGVTEQLIGAGQFGAEGFRYCGSILPLPDVLDSRTCRQLLDQVRGLMQFLVREFGLIGVNGFDFIFDGTTVWLTEVNPRYSASMELIERAYNLPIFHLHCEAVIQGCIPDFQLESKLDDRMFFGKSILFCERDCTAPERLNCPPGDLRDIPMSGERLKAGMPVCTILASRPAYSETFNVLVRRAGKIKEQIYG